MTAEKPSADTDASPPQEAPKREGAETVAAVTSPVEEGVAFQARFLWILAGVGGGAFVALAVGTFLVMRRR